MSDPVIDRSMAVRIATQLGWEPKREWVGLSDEELLDLADMAYVNDLELLQTLQAKLKEKNGG
jgi:hypothetical protein